jgi:choline dehydrogenase-like flavoprotein
VRTERVDVCVIGSGAGGSIVAHDAARCGLSTLVLERGPYLRSEDMNANEPDMIPRLYKDGGMQLNTSLDFFILQGSCVGGSTVVSNMVLMRADDAVFARWARRGAAFDVADVRVAYEHIERTLDARMPQPQAASLSTKLFAKGARDVGLHPQPMLKALGDCVACGNCNIGCSFGTKKSALTTFVRWAEDAGARVLADTEVQRVKIHRGRVSHVEARRHGERLRIFAKKVVVAAGAIGSSAVLLASGLKKHVGRRLSFNVGAMMVAEYDEPIDSFDADQMTTYVKHEGALIEATHNPIMSAALTTPGWLREHADLMHRARHLGYAGAMAGSEPVGRVVMSPFFGHEETRFKATERDMHTLRGGLRAIARAFLAAGAKRVLLPTEKLTALRSERDLDVIDARVRRMRDVQCGSSHPQGGNAMSDDPELGVVDTRFAVHGVEGLYVCDASVFPDSVEVNPMHTVMALASIGSRRILAS